MNRRVVVAAVLAGSVALVLTGVSSATVYSKCVPNQRPGAAIEKNHRIRLFCGTARVTFRQSGVTRSVTNGMCLRYPNVFIVAIGKLTQPQLNQTPLYKAYYVAFPALKDGTFKQVLGRYQVPGRDVFFTATFHVTGKRSKATFSGHTTLPNRKPGPALAGTITCK